MSIRGNYMTLVDRPPLEVPTDWGLVVDARCHQIATSAGLDLHVPRKQPDGAKQHGTIAPQVAVLASRSRRWRRVCAGERELK